MACWALANCTNECPLRKSMERFIGPLLCFEESARKALGPLVGDGLCPLTRDGAARK